MVRNQEIVFMTVEHCVLNECAFIEYRKIKAPLLSEVNGDWVGK